MTRSGQSLSHESALAHVTGEALYTDDLLLRFPGVLHAWPVLAPHAHAELTRLDAAHPALATPGVVTVLTAADVPGEGDSGPVRHDEPIFPTEVMFHHQPVAWVLAENLEAARLGALAVVADYRRLAPILSIEDAIAAGSFHSGPLAIRRGDAAAALAHAAHRIEGEIQIGGQEHFYLETQATLAWLDPSGGVSLHSSTQHPSETQEIVARVLGVPRHMVTVECLRMGGAFGGKETQANCFAAVAALGAQKTGRPVRIRFSRRLDMTITGKRHPFLARFAAGFDNSGRIQSARIELFADGGWSLDLSEAILGRAMFHVDNAYFIPALEVTGYVCKTHKTSQTAFRGFGGPQGMLVIEDILHRIARTLGLPPDEVRERNFYREGHATHYGQPVKDAQRIARIWDQLMESSRYRQRRADIDAFNAAQPTCRRGIAITPVKFGISFTATHYNQAGALVLVYRDGSVQVNHGGTEMGQGLYTKIGQIAVDALGVRPESIRLMPTRTDKIPNTSATAASSGADLNGAAVLDACRTIRATLETVAASLLECGPADLHFENGTVDAAGRLGRSVTFAEVAEAAYRPPPVCRSSASEVTIARRKSITIPRPARAAHSTTSPMAPPFPKSKSMFSPANIACCAPISSKMSARASRPSSIAVRSKAASFRASAGSPSKNCYGMPKAVSPPMAHPPISCHPGLRCLPNSTSIFWPAPPSPASSSAARPSVSRPSCSPSPSAKPSATRSHPSAPASLQSIPPARPSASSSPSSPPNNARASPPALQPQSKWGRSIRERAYRTGDRSLHHSPHPAQPFSAIGRVAILQRWRTPAGRRLHPCTRGDYAALRATPIPMSPCTICRGGFLLPGFITDTHVHFPQLRIIGGLGSPLLDWLNRFALPEEVRMGDTNYAVAVAGEFVRALASHGTTTALVFGSHFHGATAALFHAAAASGLRITTGLVLSDRLLPDPLRTTAPCAYQQSRALIERFHARDGLRYAVTPRFALSASEAMLDVCQTLLREFPDVAFQTHLNENPQEVADVLRAFPRAQHYLSAYDRFGLVGPRSVFAHNLHVEDCELHRLSEAGAAVAHCPCSNAALGSGFFPCAAILKPACVSRWERTSAQGSASAC